MSSLYDAYYDELESYALHQQRYASLPPGTIPPPPGPGPFPGSVDPSTLPATPPADSTAAGGAGAAAGAKPQRGRVVKPTRDHKNVRPAALSSHHKKKPHTSGGDVLPGHTHGHTHAHGQAGTNNPSHGEPGHTHSTSCPHHPQQATGTAAPSTGGGVAESRQKNKAAVVHPEEPDEDEYDDDDGEYDDEDDEGEDGDGDYDEEEEEEEEEEDDDEEVMLALFSTRVARARD